jgi:hypothetical protein
MRYLVTSLVLLLAHSSPANSIGRTVGYGELFTHFVANIVAVQTCGKVQLGDDWGYFRLIQARIYGSTMLFVDIALHTREDPYWRILRGYTFDEFNNDHLDQELTEVSCVGSEMNKIIVTGRVRPFEFEDDEHGFRLDIDGLSGDYTYVKRVF